MDGYAKIPDIIIYIHDDVTIHEENWFGAVMGLFENPNCVVVGLGGATSLGHPDLYKKPYKIERMARGGYCSNQTDAEVHGVRFTGEKRVAVLDAFLMAVRRDWLVSIGGWPVKHLTHHGLDLWVCLEAARAGKEVWMTGVSCTHHGGGTSTKTAYRDATWLQGGNRDADHALPHVWLYENYRDVLPLEVK
jgi:GT2 family glycosyltransferase